MIEDELLPDADDGMEDDTPCLKCRGRCYDRNDDPCGVCHGEGVILAIP